MSRRKKKRAPRPPDLEQQTAGSDMVQKADDPEFSTASNGGYDRDDATSSRTIGYVILAVLLIAQFTLLITYYGMASTYSPPLILRSNDCLVQPGQEARVRIIIDHEIPPLLRRTYAGRELLIFPAGDEASAQRATTDAAGSALFRWQSPGTEGVFPWSARLDLDGASYTTSFAVHVVAADAKLAICSVRGTLIQGQKITPLLARRGAGKALSRLARSHTIVYVDPSLRPDPTTIRKLIETQKFPTGPVFGWSTVGAMDVLEPVAEQLKELGPRKQHISWAITASASEADAFSYLQLRTLFLGSRALLFRATKKTFCEKNWDKAASRLR